MGYGLGISELWIMHRRMAGMLEFSCKESCYYTLIGVLRTPWWLRVPTGHISLYSMYPVMGNQRPTDAMLPDGLQVPQLSHGRAHLAILDVPGYGESASYGRMVPDGLQVPQLSHGRAYLAMLDVPGYGESASYGRMVPDGVQTHSFLTTGDIIHNSYFIIMISRGIC